jgi:hypothetical protein
MRAFGDLFSRLWPVLGWVGGGEEVIPPFFADYYDSR